MALTDENIATLTKVAKTIAQRPARPDPAAAPPAAPEAIMVPVTIALYDNVLTFAIPEHLAQQLDARGYTPRLHIDGPNVGLRCCIVGTGSLLDNTPPPRGSKTREAGYVTYTFTRRGHAALQAWAAGHTFGRTRVTALRTHAASPKSGADVCYIMVPGGPDNLQAHAQPVRRSGTRTRSKPPAPRTQQLTPVASEPDALERVRRALRELRAASDALGSDLVLTIDEAGKLHATVRLS